MQNNLYTIVGSQWEKLNQGYGSPPKGRVGLTLKAGL